LLNPLIGDEEQSQPNVIPLQAITSVKEFFLKQDNSDDTPAIYFWANLKVIETWLIDVINQETPDNPLDIDKIEEWHEIIEQKVSNSVNHATTMKKMDTYAYQRASEEYFGEYFKRHGKEIEKFKELYETGKLYCPPGGVHSWEANLQWLLDRLKNNTKFIIMSKVDEDSRKRTSFTDGSGFSREIATCFKMGYCFEKDGNEIVIKHLNSVTLKTLNIDDLRMTEEEGAMEFTKAIENYNLLLQRTHLAELAMQITPAEIDNPSSSPSTTTNSSQPEEQEQFNLQSNTRKRPRSLSPK
jgi:hypothetical protein